MKKNLLSTIVFLALVINVHSQTAKEKTEKIIAEFNQQANKNKKEVKSDVEIRPDLRPNTATYAAAYKIQNFSDYMIFRQQAAGWEGEYMTFEKEVQLASFKNIKIEDALLTAVMVDRRGKEKPFEGVFVNYFVNGEKSTGLGIKQVMELANGFMVNKAYYKRIE